jgi:uncharacterized membrane protein YgdD (TMEM256/DUF423 family)
MSAKLWLVLGAVYGGTGVALGAFGAHALRTRVSEDLLAAWRTGVEYQMYHALALLLCGLWAQRAALAPLQWAGGAFALGVLLFSGSLYLLVLTGIRSWGAVTPVGGGLFLAGWALLLVAAVRYT